MATDQPWSTPYLIFNQKSGATNLVRFLNSTTRSCFDFSRARLISNAAFLKRMAPIPNSKIDPPRYYREVLSEGIRPDGRVLDEFRPVSVNVKSFHNADGSAIVKIGNTTVVCGIKAELAKPKPETPEQGYLIPNVDLPPLCSGLYQPGPPSDYAQKATKFVDEVLQNSNCIDLKELCIVYDRLCWVLYLDIICLNQDGSLLDGCTAAAIAALKVLTLPEVLYDQESGEKTVNTEKQVKLCVKKFPVSTTFAVFDSNCLINDPTADEEALSSGTVTIVVEANSGDICGLHHPGTEPLKPSEIEYCLSEAQKKTKALAELIDVAIKSPASSK